MITKSTPRRALVLCGNCHNKYYTYLARKESFNTMSKCEKCNLNAVNIVWQAPLESLLSFNCSVKFDAKGYGGITGDCIKDSPQKTLFSNCQNCPYFIDSIGFEVYCQLKLDMIFNEKPGIEAYDVIRENQLTEEKA